MFRLTCWIVFVSLLDFSCSFPDLVSLENNTNTIRVRYEFQVNEEGAPAFTQKIDTWQLGGLAAAKNCTVSDDEYCLAWGTSSQFRVRRIDDQCLDFHYWTERAVPLHVAFDLTGVQLVGGSEIDNQTWPIKVTDGRVDSFVSKNKNSEAVLEPVWYTPSGFSVIVNQSVPLFVNYTRSFVNFTARLTAPYIRAGNVTHLEYRVCKYDSIKTAFARAVNESLGKPSSAPDYRMVELPVWSTWAKYKRNISEATVLELATLIDKYGFPNSQLEIDDMWETCYGSLTVDTQRFPDMKALVAKLHGMGFRVTMWVHPFVNTNCAPYFQEGRSQGFFVQNVSGSVATTWWNGNGSYIDFTNPAAVAWFQQRLQKLRSETGVDSFKFDAGESGWSPQVPRFHTMADDHPETILKSYVAVAATYGPMVEVRVARQTQQHPIFVRMMDRDTRWTSPLGLNTLIPELLHMNVIGYPYVLPDMIGGNGYDNATVTKEMFVRWLQANVFMPSVQFSYPPWDFDEEVVNITLKYVALHKQYADTIYALMKLATVQPTMVNAPIWWIDPTDTVAQTIDSEYLLGDVLVAPVLTMGATSRDIYFPKGSWRDETNKSAPLIVGPTWVKNYPATLEVLPYFTRISVSSSAIRSPSLLMIFFTSLFLFYK